MKVFKPGTKVQVPAGEAVVITVIVGLDGVRYEIGFWNDANWVQFVVPDCGITSVSTETCRIGFHGER